MAGCPAITVNGGWTDTDDDGKVALKRARNKNFFGKAAIKIPIGLQITAAPFAESVIFRAARAFEREHS